MRGQESTSWAAAIMQAQIRESNARQPCLFTRYFADNNVGSRFTLGGIIIEITPEQGLGLEGDECNDTHESMEYQELGLVQHPSCIPWDVDLTICFTQWLLLAPAPQPP